MFHKKRAVTPVQIRDFISIATAVSVQRARVWQTVLISGSKEGPDVSPLISEPLWCCKVMSRLVLTSRETDSLPSAFPLRFRKSRELVPWTLCEQSSPEDTILLTASITTNSVCCPGVFAGHWTMCLTLGVFQQLCHQTSPVCKTWQFYTYPPPLSSHQ